MDETRADPRDQAPSSGGSGGGTLFGRRGAVVERDRGPAPAGRALAPGERVAHFTLVRFVARGGMGQVWEARDEHLRASVALKLVLPDMVDERALAYFAREARAGGRLAHPNVVRTLAHGSDGELAWIAQELVEGSWTLKDSIDELRSEERLPPGYYREVARLVAGIADGLGAAHGAGVVHRDIKPANVLITADDVPKVTDFGVARVADDSFVSGTGAAAGTWAYMSPEQVESRRGGVDERSDVFGLGIVLYELLTLRRPFEGDTTHQVAERILGSEPLDPRRIRSQCPRELAVIAGKALEKDPARRYASMGEFAADLRRHLADEPIAARPPGPATRALKWTRRHPVWGAVGAVSVVALGAMAALLVRALRAEADARTGWGEAEQAAARAEDERVAADGARALAERRAYSAYLLATQAALDDGNVGEARRRLDMCAEALRGWEWRHLDAALRLPLWVGRGGGWAPAAVRWSPDGTTLADVSWLGQLTLRAGDTGEVMAWHQLGVEQVQDIAWGPGAPGILVVGKAGLARAVDPANGATLWDVPMGEELLIAARWSPDGTRALVSSIGGPVALVDARDGHVIARFPHNATAAAGLAWSPDGTRFATGGMDGSVLFHRAEGPVVEARFRGGASSQMDLAWSPVEDLVALASWRAEVVLLDPDGGKELRRIPVAAGASTVHFTRDGARLLVGCMDGSVAVWDTTSWERISTLHEHPDDVRVVEPRPGAAQFATMDRDGGIAVWDVGILPPHREVPMATSGCASFDVGGAPERALVASTRGSVRLVDMATGRAMGTVPYIAGGELKVSMAPGGAQGAVGVEDGSIVLLDLDPLARTATLTGHGKQVHTVAWSPEGSRFATVSEDCTVKVWEKAGGEVSELWGRDPADQRIVTDAAWSPDGAWLAVAAEDPSLRLFDPGGTEVGKFAKPSAGNSFQVHGTLRPGDPLAWSPDGASVVAGTDAGALIVFDARSGAERARLLGHGKSVLDVAWSPDGRRIASCSEDHSVRIWDPVTGDGMVTFTGVVVLTLRWSGDGARLYGAGDGFHVWESDPVTARTFALALDGRRRALARVDRLFEQLVLQGDVLAALEEGEDLTEEERAEARALAAERRDPTPADLNRSAWPLVDPDRGADTDVVRGLALARALVRLAPEEPSYLDTLAWALLANGLGEEACAASARALELAPPAERAEYRGYLERLQAALEGR